jgi:hypothetical protein
VHLFRRLLKEGVDATGTMGTGRGQPLSIQREKRDKGGSKPQSMVRSQGDHAFCRAIDPPEMTCVTWFDSDLMWFLSNTLEPTTTTVKRCKKGCAGKVDVSVVDHCVQYNQFTGGCDVTDMKHALGMSRSKTYKWYLALFFFMIDVTVINRYQRRGCVV